MIRGTANRGALIRGTMSVNTCVRRLSALMGLPKIADATPAMSPFTAISAAFHAMTNTSPSGRDRNAKFRRARIRNFLFTVGPNRLTGGRISRRHLSKEIDIRRIEIESPIWPKAFDGLHIGHVSDFHLGELLPVDRAISVVEQLALQEPDLIACTGDVVDLHHYDAKPLLRAMVEAGAPLGAALVLGNHDELHCPDTICRMAEHEGMMVLRNEAIKINRNGDPLTLAGIEWAKTSAACARFVERACNGGSDLLLAHNPKAFPAAADRAVPLTLSGHTHGGQIALKGRPNANLAISHRHSAGLFEKGHSRLFVTTGVGSWFPLRLNCPAEIAIITMKHAARPAITIEDETVQDV